MAYRERTRSGSLPVREQDCPSHHGEQLEAFCITCDKAICYKCAAINHQQCNKGNLEVACSEKKADINALLDRVQNNLIKPLQCMITKSEQHREMIVNSAKEAKSDIVDHFDTCQQLLQQCKVQFLNDVDHHCDKWKTHLEQEHRHFTADLHSAMQTSEAARQLLVSTRQHSHLIAAAPDTAEQLANIHKLCERLRNCPLDTPQKIRFSADLQDFRHSISQMGALKPDVMSIVRAPSLALQNMYSTFVVKCGLPSAPVVHVQPPEGDAAAAETVVCRHSEAQEGYLVKLKTRALGKHKVHVKVSGCEVDSEDKAFDVQSLPVPGKPKKTIGTYGEAYNQFKRPGGVSVCEGNHILLADSDNHRVQEFDSDGQLVCSFRGKGRLSAAASHPSGVVLATDQRDAQIQVFSHDGRALKTIGRAGTSPGQFNSPNGIGVTSDGNVVVADTFNHRIQVVDINGRPVRQFSSSASNEVGKLQQPWFLAISQNDDHIFVANYNSHSVEEFSKDGQHLHSFGQGHGSELGELDHPTGVALHPSGHLLVADCHNHRVSVFTREGECVGFWADMHYPADVACTDSGQLFVSEQVRHKLQAY